MDNKCSNSHGLRLEAWYEVEARDFVRNYKEANIYITKKHPIPSSEENGESQTEISAYPLHLVLEKILNELTTIP